jgi:hypothetical protein
MMNMTGVKTGDEVRVFDVNGRRKSQPEGGWPGVVTAVGRKLFTVEYPRAPQGEVFRLETGQRHDNYGHQWVLTEERASDETRRIAATDTLRRCRLQFSSLAAPGLYTTAQLEALAELAMSFLEAGDGGQD